jgi:hypothetical protein
MGRPSIVAHDARTVRHGKLKPTKCSVRCWPYNSTQSISLNSARQSRSGHGKITALDTINTAVSGGVQFSRHVPLCSRRKRYVCIDVGLTVRARSGAADPGLSDAGVPCQSPRKYIQPEPCPNGFMIRGLQIDGHARFHRNGIKLRHLDSPPTMRKVFRLLGAKDSMYKSGQLAPPIVLRAKEWPKERFLLPHPH